MADPYLTGPHAAMLALSQAPVAGNVSGPASRMWLPTVAKMESANRAGVALANATTVTSGTLRLTALGLLRAGDSLASLTVISATTPAGTPLNQWMALVRASDLQIMAVSPDKTTEAWAASTPKTFTFNTAYTAAADERMFAGLLVVATTVPTMVGVVTLAAAVVGPTLQGNSTATLTTPLPVTTLVTAPTASSQTFYCYAS